MYSVNDWSDCPAGGSELEFYVGLFSPDNPQRTLRSETTTETLQLAYHEPLKGGRVFLEEVSGRQFQNLRVDEGSQLG